MQHIVHTPGGEACGKVAMIDSGYTADRNRALNPDGSYNLHTKYTD